METQVSTSSQKDTSEQATREISRFDARMKCFEFVLVSLDQCRKDESLIGSRLLHPSSSHLSVILETLWTIQRNESLVGLIARGLDRHQTRAKSSTSTSVLPSNLLNLNNKKKMERRIQLAKLSVLWMRTHCLQVILADLSNDPNHQVFRCHLSQQVLNRYFNLSPSGYHRTTRSPYLPRLLTSPSCAADYVGAAEDFLKIWKTLREYLTQQPRAPVATIAEDLLAQLNLLAEALNLSETYLDPLELIKSCACALIRQTLDWTLEAYHDAATVAKRASIFKSRPTILPTQSEPPVVATTESELQVAPPNELESQVAKLSKNPDNQSRQADFSGPLTAAWKQARHSMGPLMDGSVINSMDSADRPTNKKRRRSTDCGGQASNKRQHLDPIVEFENQKSSKKLLKEFRDSPRLSSAFEQARQMAIQTKLEASEDSDPTHSHGYESTGSSSVDDDQNAELDPAIVEKLKANAAQFGKQEQSYFARLMMLAATGEPLNDEMA